MSQKIITVTGYADTQGSKSYQETEFKQVNEALNEGYLVKQVHQSGAATDKTGWYVITFVLELDDSYKGPLPISGGR